MLSAPVLPRSLHLVLALMTLTSVLLTGVARAQSTAVDPYYVSPKRDRVEMRCNPMGTSYVVAQLGADVVLKVDATAKDGSSTWLQVEYPPGTPALAMLDEVSPDAGGRTMTVTRPAALRAINMQYPTLEQSFISIFITQRLPIGTKLELVRAIKDANGATSAYVVKAPAGARGWVMQQDVEKTTEKAYRTFMGLPAVDPERVTPPVEPVRGEEGDGATGDGEVNGGAGSEIIDEGPAIEDAGDGEGEGDLAGGVTPDDEGGASEQDAGEPVADGDTVPVVSEAPLPPHMETFRKLEAAYATVNGEPLESAEFDSLIDAYEHLDATIPDEAINQPVRRVVEARLAMLRLRRDFQNTLFALDEFESQGPGRGSAATTGGTPHYTVVGRLRRSVVYDGTNLPLLYRVMSVENTDPRGAGRTLAYVKPTDALELPLKLNTIVGVVSTQKIDRRRMVNILEPTAVEVLER